MKKNFLIGFENKLTCFFKSSPVMQVYFMNGVSQTVLYWSDKHICCIVIAVMKKKGNKEGKKEIRREGREEI